MSGLVMPGAPPTQKLALVGSYPGGQKTRLRDFDRRSSDVDYLWLVSTTICEPGRSLFIGPPSPNSPDGSLYGSFELTRMGFKPRWRATYRSASDICSRPVLPTCLHQTDMVAFSGMTNCR